MALQDLQRAVVRTVVDHADLDDTAGGAQPQQARVQVDALR